MKEDKNGEFLYKNIIKEDNKNSHVWSAVSIGIGILSVILCFIPVVSLIFALASIAFAVVSRRMLGYFGKPSVIGLVIGIFGLVFGIAFALFDFMQKNTSFFEGLFG